LIADGETMITYLEGKLVEEEPTHIVVENDGVGYFVHIPVSSYKKFPNASNGIKVFTHLHVREDDLQLYGFATREERHLFRLLISVAGVGPRLAQGVLSGISVEQFRACMARGDLVPLTAIPGVGKKTAQRLLVDLREKVGVDVAETGLDDRRGPEVESDLERNAIKALISLGCRQREAERLVRAVRTEEAAGQLTLEELILKALQHS
jgi:Holliday junction DNA helicase RuvA